MKGVIGKHGITADTPDNILLGAGTYLKNLVWDSATTSWKGDILGATNGGGKISIKGELQDIELDGALVKIKGHTIKQGGTANAEVNFAVITKEILQKALLFKESTSDANGFTLLEDKPHIEDGDYIDNFGFVGETVGGKQIIVIFESALCTSGLDLEGKSKEQSVVKLTLEACAENKEGSEFNTLPVKIYYPEVAVV